jgi:hypothetical protein
VAVRRRALPGQPFGSHCGRIGGDGHLTAALRTAGHRVLLVPELIVYHEDISYTLRGTLERHLREHLLPLHYGTARQRFSAVWTLASVVALRPLLRLKRVVGARARIGLGLRHVPAALALNAAYYVFDAAAVLAVLAVPRWRRRWLDFVYGA